MGYSSQHLLSIGSSQVYSHRTHKQNSGSCLEEFAIKAKWRGLGEYEGSVVKYEPLF